MSRCARKFEIKGGDSITTRPISVLFLCRDHPCMGRMAQGFLETMGKNKNGLEVRAYSLEECNPTFLSSVTKVMREVGIDLLLQPTTTTEEISRVQFDLIVHLCMHNGEGEQSTEPNHVFQAPLFIGMPVHLHWKVSKLDFHQEDDDNRLLSELRIIRDRLESNVKSLFELEFLDAVARQRQHRNLLLDAMDDGIIVHDQQRHIYLFNRAAEEITGYPRDEVLGRDCYEVFAPDGLCGSQCKISEHQQAHPLNKKHLYEVTFTDKQGADHRLRVASGSMRLEPEGQRGLIAAFRDITEVSQLRRQLKEKYSFHGMVGQSVAMREVFQTIRQIVSSEYPVLITGESGTGKELVARAIHNESRRQAGPFVPINCGALPENILESELFGHVRGAFTGAIRDKKGRFELAHHGTLFLDEVGELSTAFQVKLLRVLEEKRFEPVGAEQSVSVDVRIISATNRDPREMVTKGTFRGDLYYRLCVVPIHLPPLRDRKEDLAPLVTKILQNIRQETGSSIHSLSDEVMDLLSAYGWPGNIRELINVLQYASVQSSGEEILTRHLPPELRTPAFLPDHLPGKSTDGHSHRRRKLTRLTVEKALEESDGNKVKAAKMLGIGRATLYRILNNTPST